MPNKRQRQVATACDPILLAKPRTDHLVRHRLSERGPLLMKPTRRLAMVAKVPPVLASLLISDSGSAGRSPRQPADSSTSGIDKYR